MSKYAPLILFMALGCGTNLLTDSLCAGDGGSQGFLELLRGTQATGTLQCHGRMEQVYHNFLEF